MMTELEELQSRIAFQEDTISVLSDQIAAQDQVIIALQKQMKQLNSKLNDLVYQVEQGSPAPGNERPPHY